ncbi:MAG: D-alanyl-D-alanine carboxypeptidase/D-alanyl-D-alanine-endopeptidase [Pseudomonadota bacterium]
MQRFGFVILVAWLMLLVSACQTSIQPEVEAALANPDQTGIRWGLVVAEMDGSELLAIRADDRFTPASNTKIVTTMASYHHLERLSQPQHNPGTQVILDRSDAEGPPDLILRGGGDAMLADASDCETHCLAELADRVADTGLTEINQVIGDDTLFPFERWGPGWSVEDLQFYYGTAVSALSVNDNLVWIDVVPGMAEGDPVEITWQVGDAYYGIANDAVTSAADADRALRVQRYPGATSVRVYGTVPAGSQALSFGLAIDNPAEFAALRFSRLLEARGLTVGGISTLHRPLTLADEAPVDKDTPANLVSARIADAPLIIVNLPASDLTESLKRISKESENLHAEIALRRLGLVEGTGSRDFGTNALESFLTEAGVTEQGITLYGGSGMSIYNRISPRAMVRLLAFAAEQPWFEAWLADQPIGGVDGSLARRFTGTALEGKIFAKTGTLNGANALAGVMTASSGQQLLFSIIANDRPPATRSAIAEMDAALVAIAERY